MNKVEIEPCRIRTCATLTKKAGRVTHTPPTITIPMKLVPYLIRESESRVKGFSWIPSYDGMAGTSASLSFWNQAQNKEKILVPALPGLRK